MLIDPVLVEFFGLPGSGKTTLSYLIQQRLITERFDVSHRDDLMRWVQSRTIPSKIARSLLYPCWTVCLAYNLLLFYGHTTLKHPAFLKDIAKLVNTRIYLDAFIKQRRPDILLLDQWSVQTIWSNWIGRKSNNHENLSKNVNYTEKFHQKKYLFFSITPEEAASRIAGRTRGGSRFDEYDINTIKDMLFSQTKVMNALFSVIKCQERDVLFLNASKPLEFNLEVVMDWLATRLTV